LAREKPTLRPGGVFQRHFMPHRVSTSTGQGYPVISRTGSTVESRLVSTTAGGVPAVLDVLEKL
jgi:hypothetical protein